MVKILLQVDWTLSGTPQDSFYKAVLMPTVPPIGTELWLNSEDGDYLFDQSFRVDEVHWDEGRDAYFEVHINAPDFTGAESEVIKEFLAAGWSHRDLPDTCS